MSYSDVSYMAPPPSGATRVYRSTPQLIPTSASTAIVFDTVAFDTLGAANLAVNNNLLTIRTPGLYLVGCCIEWAGAASGFGYGEVWKNSFSHMVVEGAGGGIPLTDGPEISGFAPVMLSTGDTLQLNAFQSSGSSLNATSSNNNVAPSLFIVLLH